MTRKREKILLQRDEKTRTRVEQVLFEAAAAIKLRRNDLHKWPDDVEALHQYRISLRVARSLTKFLAPYQDAKQNRKLKKALKQLQDPTSRVRELDVLVPTLEEGSEPRALCEQAQAETRTSFFDGFNDEATQAKLDEVMEALKGFKWNKHVAKNGLAARKLARRIEVERKLCEKTLDLMDFDDIETVHNLRKRAKALRYVARELKDYLPGDPGAVSGRMREVQDKLGEWCDARVDAKLVDEICGEAGAELCQKYEDRAAAIMQELKDERAEREAAKAAAKQAEKEAKAAKKAAKAEAKAAKEAKKAEEKAAKEAAKAEKEAAKAEAKAAKEAKKAEEKAAKEAAKAAEAEKKAAKEAKKAAKKGKKGKKAKKETEVSDEASAEAPAAEPEAAIAPEAVAEPAPEAELVPEPAPESAAAVEPELEAAPEADTPASLKKLKVADLRAKAEGLGIETKGLLKAQLIDAILGVDAEPKLPKPAQAVLTKREETVLPLILAGNSNAEIAESLGISVNTVRNHVAHILDKFEVKNREELAAKIEA